MKKSILIIMILFIIGFVSPVSAEQYSFEELVPGLGSASRADQFGGYYRYARVEVFASDDNASYTVSLIGVENISQVGAVSPISTSVKKFTGSNRYIIYILPRSGMSCPSDANYCFGAGSDYSSSTVIQGNECRGGMCSMYGIRVNNRKIFTGYNVNVKYEFFY